MALIQILEAILDVMNGRICGLQRFHKLHHFEIARLHIPKHLLIALDSLQIRRENLNILMRCRIGWRVVANRVPNPYNLFDTIFMAKSLRKLPFKTKALNLINAGK